MDPSAALPRDDSLPSDLPGFLARFGTELSCAELLRRWRYPTGFRCGRCGSKKAWYLEKRRLDECAGCGHQVSLTAGTMFHRTRKPLRSWFAALFLFVSSKQGMSAMELGRQLGMREATAWAWLHKIRHSLGARASELLRGTVEVDEAFFGAHGAEDEIAIVGAVEARDRGAGRVRFLHIREATGALLQAFVAETVEPGSTIITDGATMYKGLKGYRHEVQIAGKGYDQGDVLPHFHTAVSNLRAWLLGTFHGAVRPVHLLLEAVKSRSIPAVVFVARVRGARARPRGSRARRCRPGSAARAAAA